MTVKISNLPAATSVGSGDVLPVVQSGTTKKIDLNSPWSINIDGGNIDGTAIGASSASSGAFTTLTASDDVNFDSGTLFVDASANAVGIGTTSPTLFVSDGSGLQIYGSAPQLRLNNDTTGATSSDGFHIILASDDVFYNNQESSGKQRFYIGGQERMTIDSSGHAIIPAGVTLGTAAGVYNAANTLDDYETGTWTPAITSGWSSVSYAQQVGKYTKIGNQITAFFVLQFSGTSAAQQIQITGLPFTVGSGSRGGALTYYDAPTNETTGILIYPGTGIDFYADNDSGSLIQSNGNASNDFLIGSVTYLV